MIILFEGSGLSVKGDTSGTAVEFRATEHALTFSELDRAEAYRLAQHLNNWLMSTASAAQAAREGK